MANHINLIKRKVCGKALCPWMEKLSQIGRSYPWNSKEIGLEGKLPFSLIENFFRQINSLVDIILLQSFNRESILGTLKSELITNIETNNFRLF